MGSQLRMSKILLIILILNFGSEASAAKKSKQNINKRAVASNPVRPNKIGTNEPSFCKLMEEPEKLYTATPAQLARFTAWRTRMLTSNPETKPGQSKKEALTKLCLKTCREPSDELISFCNGLATCQKECISAKIIENKNCTKSTACVQKECSPMPDRNGSGALSAKDDLIRSKVFIAMANKVVHDFIYKDPPNISNDSDNTYKNALEYVRSYLVNYPNTQASYASTLPQTMRCLNNVENPSLEPIMQHNSYVPNAAICGHAFGLGQVVPETYYSNLGIYAPGTLSVQPLRNPCSEYMKEFTIAELPKRCDNDKFQAQFYRIELFQKYKNLTPQQMHNIRPFDVELQIRLMMAVIVNKIIENRSWRAALTSYGGNARYANYVGTNSCVQNNTLDTLNRKADKLKQTEGI